MPYYNAGDYYQGDYYQAGGFLRSIGKFVGGVAKSVIGSTPLGGVVSALVPSFGRPKIAPSTSGFGGPSIVPVPGFRGFGQRLIPGGESGYMYGKRRRMNPLNIKALRRAMRRAKGFERQARRVGSFFNPGKTFRLKGRARKRS